MDSNSENDGLEMDNESDESDDDEDYEYSGEKSGVDEGDPADKQAMEEEIELVGRMKGDSPEPSQC